MQLAYEGEDIAAAIAEFEMTVRAMFANHRRDIELLRSRVKDRARGHKARAELQKRLERAVTAELQRECRP